MILTGTTTPNCIRTTCYDAMALEYNTVILTDCCSSQTEGDPAGKPGRYAAGGCHF